MNKKYLVSILSLILGCVFLYSCKKVENLPVIPAITFKSFQTYGSDSAVCKINFVDGDGDIGLDPYMTQPPFDPSSRFYNDLFLTYYWDSLGNWVVGLKSVAIGYAIRENVYRIPNLSTNGQTSALEGEIKVKIPAPYSIPGQTFKYKIQLYDRALHPSNVVWTDAKLPP
ncbi:MAG: hypothetical protein ACHQRM_03225 [Bacteroidia bacterium]